MHASEKLSLEQIRQLVAASEGLRFESENRRQMYGWVESVLIEHGYARQGKVARGLLRRYIEKMTGLSPALVTRLIAGYRATGQVRVAAYRRHRFRPRSMKPMRRSPDRPPGPFSSASSSSMARLSSSGYSETRVDVSRSHYA